MMDHLQPGHRNLPSEILEAFIDELGRSPTSQECWHALQQCALVSRAFRNRAHHHLFSKIEFIQRSYIRPSTILSRMWKLRDIVACGQSIPQMTGLLYHLRSFTLVMDGSVFEAYAILENDDLVAILRAVQAHSKGLAAVTVQGSSFPIVWADLTLDFREAFMALCRTAPNLTTMRLANMVGVPHTLLMGTRVTHVRFHLIDFKKPRMAFVIFREGHLPKGQLESMDIDYTFPFPPSSLIDSRLEYEDAMVHYSTIFANVTRLRYLIYRSDDLERFVAAAKGISGPLESLSLELSNSDNAFLRTLSWEIPLSDLPHLQRVAIRHSALISAGTLYPLLKVSTILRAVSVPTSLETIELAFEVAAQAPWLKAPHFFPEPKTWALLDADLMSAKFDSVRNVVLRVRYCVLQVQPWTFDEAVFVDRCRKVLKSVFPLVAASEKKKITLIVGMTTEYDAMYVEEAEL